MSDSGDQLEDVAASLPSVDMQPPPVSPPAAKATSLRGRMVSLIVAVAVFVVVGILVHLGTEQGSSVSDAHAVKTTTAAQTPNGFQQYTDSVDHFSIAAPKAWTNLNFSDQRLAAALTQLMNEHPKLKALVAGGGPTASKAIKFETLTLGDGSPSAYSSLSVVVTSDPAFEGVSPQDLEHVVTGELHQRGISLTSSGLSSMAGHSAVRITYPSSDFGGAASQTQTQYIFLVGNTAYFVTQVGQSPDLAQIEQTLKVS